MPHGTAIRVRPGTTTTGPSARSHVGEQPLVERRDGAGDRAPDGGLQRRVGAREGVRAQVAREPVGQRRRPRAAGPDVVQPAALRGDDQDVLLAVLGHPHEGLLAAGPGAARRVVRVPDRCARRRDAVLLGARPVEVG